MDQALANSIVERSQELGQAHISEKRRLRPQTIHRMTLDLSTARDRNNPLEVNFAFKSFFVEDVSSPSGLIFFRPITRESSQEQFKIRLRDGWSVDYEIPTAFLHWDSQPGVTMDIVFLADSTFRSGSQVSLTAGGVSISDGATAELLSPVAGTALTAAELLPQDSNRKVGTLVNDSGGDIFLGHNGLVTDTGGTRGIIWPAGERLNWNNTAALWGYFLASGPVTRMRQG